MHARLDRLGEGGMGEVFKARHQRMKRIVALKIIRNDKVANASVLLRFNREIEAAAQLMHPNIVLAYDAAEDGDTHFFVMEYVRGIDLAKLIECAAEAQRVLGRPLGSHVLKAGPVRTAGA